MLLRLWLLGSYRFFKPGQRIDVSVSAIGKATNLRGGNLLLTSLRGADGEVYALAQGL